MLIETLLHTIQQDNLIPADSTVIVAVSGGADSLALLHALAQMQQRLHMKLHVATLNHGLRAEAADDVTYVQEIAQQLAIPVTVRQADVNSIAQTQQLGIEAAARRARYNFLAQVAEQQNTTIIATAHHADDQTETILMHILRGSGTQGLIGMQTQTPVPEHPHLHLIRPFLQIRRSAIEQYCDQHQLVPRTDSTNFDTVFLRNAIRLEILPHLRQKNPQIDAALNRLGDILTVEQDYMQQQFTTEILRHIQVDERISINLEQFRTWHPAMQRRVLRHCAQQLHAEPTYTHIQTALDVATTGYVGGLANFNNHIRLRVGYKKLYIEDATRPLPTEDYPQLDAPLNIQIPTTIHLGACDLHITRTRPDHFDVHLAITPNAELALRTRQAGDRFKPYGMGGKSQKLKKWFIDHKIPQHIRDNIPLFTVDNVIATIILPDNWIIAEPFAVTDATQHVIYFSCKN